MKNLKNIFIAGAFLMFGQLAFGQQQLQNEVRNKVNHPKMLVQSGAKARSAQPHRCHKPANRTIQRKQIPARPARQQQLHRREGIR